MKPSCIALDFDSTLSEFQGGKEGLFNIFVSRNVALNDVKESYEASKQDGGFTIKKLIIIIERKVQNRFDEDEIVSDFNAWVGTCVKPYSDSLPFIMNCMRQGIPVIIVTTGDPDYQRQKVACSRLPYDGIFFVTQNEKKNQILRGLSNIYGGRIVFIDDDPENLDRVSEDIFLHPHIIPILMRRAGGPYLYKFPKISHLEISELAQVEEFLQTRFPVTI